MAVITERCTEGIAKPLPPEWFIQKDTSAEMRWEAMQGQGYFVPTERFFVRNHTSTPRVDPLAYELEIHGRGLSGGPVCFTYDQLTSLPSVERTVAIECAGNGRSLFGSQQGMQVPGTAWGLGAIGVTRWRGGPPSEGPRRDRRPALARRAALRGARARRAPRRRRRRDAGRAR